MIPKIIHYIWVGPKPLPNLAKENIERWKTLNPDYKIITWNEDNIDFSAKFIQQAYGSRAYHRVSDYARLAALYKYGGIYLDHDIELIQPLDFLLQNKCFAGFQTMKSWPEDLVNNAVLGATPEHPFIYNAIQKLNLISGAQDKGSATGPGLLTKLLKEEGQIAPSKKIQVASGVTLYPSEYFYPYEWDEEYHPSCITKNTVSIHRWAHSWKTSKNKFQKLVRLLNSLFSKLFPTLSMALVKAENRIIRLTHKNTEH